MNTPPENPPEIPPQTSALGAEIFAPDPEERSWCVAAHLSGLISIFGPLIVWLLRKPHWQALDFAAKQAMNFHITILLAALVLGLAGIPTCGIAWLGLYPLGIASIVFAIVATVKTSQGERYRYPLTLHLIR